MPKNTKISDWFCAAVSGPTIDGREIKKQEIVDMADTYSTKNYTAQVFVEHLRSFSFNSDFAVMGDVLAVEVRDVKILDNDEKGLFVKIVATDQLVEYNKQRKKVFPSVEIHANFAGSGKSYLSGLAVTDDPASLGTSKIKLFSNSENKKYSQSIEAKIDFKDQLDEIAKDEKQSGLFSKLLSSLIDKKAPEIAENQAKNTENTQESDKTTESDQAFLSAIFSIAQEFEAFKAKTVNELNQLHEANKALQTQLAQLNLPKDPLFNQTQVAGSETGAIEADC